MGEFVGVGKILDAGEVPSIVVSTVVDIKRPP
jgi:hypothetical protein